MAGDDYDLNVINVSSPCNVPWSKMAGDVQVLFCDQCHCNVYNLSAMTEAEASELVTSQQQLCVRFYRRRDGTIVTANCNSERKSVWRRLAQCVAAVVSIVPINGCLTATQGSIDVQRRPAVGATCSVEQVDTVEDGIEK